MAEHIHRELVIPNETKYLATVREAVSTVVNESAFPSNDIHRIILAVDEAVANIMEHAYEGRESESELTITMALDADATHFEVVILDSGNEFDPADIETPNMMEHVAAGRRNGLGIFLMRQIMDEVKYTFVNGFRNELRMVKYVRD
ncbi:MAG: ATP-binding protein [Planctomycetota bacterium]|jgi:anti-sigma regulatory factor (Ser/Thr protein kinase)